MDEAVSAEASRVAFVEPVEETHWWFVATRELVAAAALAATPPPARILDVGSGTGRVLAELDRAYDRFGVDADPASVDVARARAAGSMRFELGDALELPCEDGWADVAICLDVLSDNGVGDPVRAVGELRRALRPGGLALVQVPAHPWLRSGHDVGARIAHRYDREGFARLLDEGGLRVERITHRVTAVFPAAVVWRLLGRGGQSSDVGPVPAPVNRTLERIGRSENRLLLRGRDLPFGLSLFAWARRDAGGSSYPGHA